MNLTGICHLCTSHPFPSPFLWFCSAVKNKKDQMIKPEKNTINVLHTHPPYLLHFYDFAVKWKTIKCSPFPGSSSSATPTTSWPPFSSSIISGENKSLIISKFSNFPPTCLVHFAASSLAGVGCKDFRQFCLQRTPTLWIRKNAFMK